MKLLKYLTAVMLISVSLVACKGRDKATLGGTSDTSAKAGTNKPAENMSTDSANDTTYKGNADPSGHGGSDSVTKAKGGQ